MSLVRKISQIKKLETINPDKNWENKTKYDILAEISSQNRMMKAQKITASQKADLFFMNFLSKLAPTFTRVVAVFLIVAMGSGVSLAAQASVPGQVLWPIKRSIEQVELSLTFSAVKTTEVHIKHVNERLEELDKILKDGALQNEDKQGAKEKAIKQAVRHLEKDVVAVDGSLKIVKEEKKPIEIVELAKKVTDATKEVATSLEAKQKQLESSANVSSNESIEKALKDAKAVNNEVKKAAVAVALEVHEEVMAVAKQGDINSLTVNASSNANIDNNGQAIVVSVENETTTIDIIEKSVEGVDQSELMAVTNLVREIVSSQLDEASSEAKDVKQKAEVVNDDDLVNIKQDTNQEYGKESFEDAELEEINTIKKENSSELETALEEARVLMEDGFLRDAFDKISEIQNKYQRAGDVLEKLQKAIDTHNTLNPDIIDDVDTTDPDVLKKNNVIGNEVYKEGALEASAIDIKEEGVLEEK